MDPEDGYDDEVEARSRGTSEQKIDEIDSRLNEAADLLKSVHDKLKTDPVAPYHTPTSTFMSRSIESGSSPEMVMEGESSLAAQFSFAEDFIEEVAKTDFLRTSGFKMTESLENLSNIFDRPNPKIPFEEKNLRVPLEPTPWPEDRTGRVSVNSFKIGGANAHVVIESAAAFLGRLERPSVPDPMSSIWNQAQLMTYSANTADSLRRQVVNNQRYIAKHTEILNDIAYTLAARRAQLPQRAFSIMENGIELNTSTLVKAPSTPNDLALVFTGQGAQWPGMALELMLSNRVFAQSIRHMDKVLRLLPDGPSWALIEELNKPKESSRLQEVCISQPLCTVVQIALVDTIRATAGIKPFAVVGHSSGEMAAVYACGKLTSNETIVAAYYRGIVSSEVTKSGAMAAVGLGRTEVNPFLRLGVGIACENSPSSVTISGNAHIIESVLTQIREAKPDDLARLLKVDTAYHSHHMQEVGDRYLTLMSLSDWKSNSTSRLGSAGVKYEWIPTAHPTYGWNLPFTYHVESVNTEN
ncbi:polyketide synthase [Colletotrichum salicis]|uniref:Polyketide synthase n=1 Tax=Colletotrichum salicis TaxID=1209931 RepID=A0A135UFX2_9PEZI|nr:polyketide synthase [Colletotrichum salicis]